MALIYHLIADFAVAHSCFIIIWRFPQMTTT